MTARVLVVDDEAAIRRRISMALGRQGLEAVEAADGLAALRAVALQASSGRPFDAVTLDLGLPDIDGLKVIALLKGRYPELNVVAVAAQPGDAFEAQVKERKGDAFVARPYEVDDLAARVAGIVGAGGPSCVGAPCVSYVLVETDKAVKPWALVSELSGLPGVQYCDPVRDSRWGLVARVQGVPAAQAKERFGQALSGRAGVLGFEVTAVEPPLLPEELRPFLVRYDKDHADSFRRQKNRATAYVVVECVPAELPALFVRLYFLDESVEIDASASGDRVVVLLQAGDFSAIRHAVSERIRMMDGVRRVHEMRVVPLEAPQP